MAAALESFRPVILADRVTPAVDRAKRAGVEVRLDPVFYLGAKTRRPGGLVGLGSRMVQAAPVVARAIRELAPAVVHCNDLPSLYMAAPVARAAGVPVLWNIRGMTNVRGWKWLAGRALADQIVTLSQEMKEAIDFALPRSKVPWGADVRVIYSGVDTETLSPIPSEERGPIRRELGIREDDFAIGVVAPVVPLKQHAELLDALMAAGDRPGERWWFVGDYSPEGSSYAAAVARRLAASQKLAAMVSTTGYQRDVATLYRAMDVVVVCSREEGLARSMIESLACGTPVVSFALTSAREVLQGGDCGVVVGQQDFFALISAVRDLRADPRRLQRYAENARSTAVRLFGGDRGTRAYESLYASMAALSLRP